MTRDAKNWGGRGTLDLPDYARVSNEHFSVYLQTNWRFVQAHKGTQTPYRIFFALRDSCVCVIYQPVAANTAWLAVPHSTC